MWVLYQLVIPQDPWDWHTFNIRINEFVYRYIYGTWSHSMGKMRLWEAIFCAMKFGALKVSCLLMDPKVGVFLVSNFRGLDFFVRYAGE